MKTIFILLAAVLSGFSYGRQESPVGDEWQSPMQLGFNKEAPHAWFFSFGDVESARKVLPENSSLWMSLDGDWKFNWAPNPDERPADFFKPDYDVSSWDDIPVPSNWNIVGIGPDGSQKYGTPIYVNVNVPWWKEVKPGDWKLGVMRTPPEDWTMYKARNEVGSYRRTFEVPESWEGDRIFIDFDGVDSFFYLWVNGKYVGFSKNSRNLAQFDITEYVTAGENMVAVEVYRNSDGSNLEAQDMFRLPGIFRTVALEAKPMVSVRDIRVTPSTGSLHVKAEVTGGGKGQTLSYHLYEDVLYSDENSLVADFEGQPADCILEYPAAKPWSAEAPHRYVLVGELKDAGGKTLDIFSTVVGFREVCIKDTPAEEDEFGIEGRYFYLNGKPVKLRGVNRHETEPSMGHVVTREVMEEDVMLMKRANLNHVRDSHYPDAPYWYYLCDKYGIYLMDEANIESHHYRYGDASLSHPVEWKDAHVARMTEMVASNFNHPCILIWSMGNEAGPGKNFEYAYAAARAIDPVRPIQYERNNDISDIGCRQYPPVTWVQEVATGKADVKYPYHINEFAHSMGNALGNFAQYWKSMDSTNFFIGAAIWDWVDQSLWNYTPEGTRYLASGGNFGDVPNDGQFVMNGVLNGDRSPKPQYWEVKKVCQNLYTSLAGVSEESAEICLFNRNYYEPCSYSAVWTLVADGEGIRSGSFDVDGLAPRTKESRTIGLGALPAGRECYLNVSYSLKEDMPWADKGFEVCRDQMALTADAVPVPELVEGQVSQPGRRAPRHFTDSRTGRLVVKGFRFKVEFDSGKGTIDRLRYRGKDVIVPGQGPRLNVFRAIVNNDAWIFRDWFAQGLQNLEHKASGMTVGEEDGQVVVEFDVESKALCAARLEGTSASASCSIVEDAGNTQVMCFSSHLKWKVARDGSVSLESRITSDKPDQVLGRLGYIMQVPASLAEFSYYGRGPVENYSDRYTCAFVGIYGSTVAEQVQNYTKPQDMANHEQVRWASLTGRRGRGVLFEAAGNSLRCSDFGRPVMSVSALPYSAVDMVQAAHQHELPEPGDTWLCLDAADTGLGGASCGPAPLEEDRVRPDATFGFVIKMK
ncbi:MAG: DUF4981 domain-containing protein [Bacteroidales bacterium]|nr:DUF4981 domain-containing protein [Bacteroidales bacterium]